MKLLFVICKIIVVSLIMAMLLYPIMYFWRVVTELLNFTEPTRFSIFSIRKSVEFGLLMYIYGFPFYIIGISLYHLIIKKYRLSIRSQIFTSISIALSIYLITWLFADFGQYDQLYLLVLSYVVYGLIFSWLYRKIPPKLYI